MNPVKTLKASYCIALGEKALRRGEGEKALAYAQRAREQRPDDPRNEGLYALWLSETGQAEKGLSCLSETEKKHRNPHLHLFKALILLDKENYTDALTAAETAVSMDGRNQLARAYAALIKLYLNQDRHPSLETIRRNLPFVNSEFAARFLLLCSALLRHGTAGYPAVLSDHQVVSELLEEPLPEAGHKKPVFSLRFARAWRLLLNPVIRAPFPAKKRLYAQRVKGAFSFFSGDLPSAGEHYDEILSKNEDDFEAALGRLLVLFLQKDFAAVETGLKGRALSDQRDEWPIVRQLAGMTAFRQGRYREALKSLTPEKKSGEMGHLSHYFKGLSHLNLGAPKHRVIRHLREAAEKEWQLVTQAVSALAAHLA